jgi:hypothetical protein
MSDDGEDSTGLRIANPNPLGYGALGFLFWMHGMIFSGLFPQEVGKLGEHASTTFVICALLVAGIVAFLRNWTWDGTLFLFWSAMEFGWLRARDLEFGTEAYVSQLWLAVALFHVILAGRAFQSTDQEPLRGLLAAGLVVLGIGWALTGWGIGPETILTGYVQLAMGPLAFWVAAQEIGLMSG